MFSVFSGWTLQDPAEKSWELHQPSVHSDGRQKSCALPDSVGDASVLAVSARRQVTKIIHVVLLMGKPIVCFKGVPHFKKPPNY
jgi:hypothetical protein